MKYNYHTHTYRCRHAIGKDRDYVEAAIDAGIEILGFSDHSPYIFPKEAGSYYSGHRMRPEELEGYVESIERLKEEFKGKIRIFKGVEIEYYPKCFSETEKFLSDAGIEYLILGMHTFGNEFDRGSFYVAGPNGASKDQFESYMSLVVECIESKKFLYVAHPDIFYFDGDREFYKKQVERVAVAAKRNNVPLEANMLGFRGRRHYPTKDFWEVVREVGAPAIFGVDAHDPAALKDADNAIRDFKNEFNVEGINFIEDEPLL